MDLINENESHSDQINQKQSKRHECLYCFRVFRTAYHLRRHSVIHSTDTKIFNCQFCELSFRLHKELLMHEGTHKRTLANINLKRCKICGITCDDGNLLAHLKEYHEHYQCDICNGLYRTKNHLKLHMITHINAREFKCSVCPKRFNFFSQVKRHERSHSATLVWYCEVCGQGFKTKPNLNHHMRSHNGEKPFQCDRCDRSYSSKQSLHLHIRIHDQIRPYKCPWAECSQSFYDLTTMKVHTRQHTNENPYICHLCGKSTKQASNLKSHYLHAHKIRDITSKTIRANARLNQKCKTENLPDSDHSQRVQQNFEKHEESISILPATIKLEATDEMVTKSESILSVGNEAKNSDGEVDNVIVAELQEKIIKKEVCDTSHENSVSLPQENEVEKERQTSKRNNRIDRRKSKRTKSEKVIADEPLNCVIMDDEEHFFEFRITELNDSDNVSEFPKTNSDNGCSTSQLKTKSKFLCDICPRTFSQKSKLKAHIESHIENNATKKVKEKCNMCEICGKTFIENCALTKHMKSHSNHRPYSCETCGRGFKNSSGLKVHNRSHSGEKPYSCIFCPKSFSTSMGRNLHQRGHTGEKPYKCTYCDSAFADQSTWKQHVRVHTGEKPYVCHLCGRGTTQAGNLKSHLRHAHKVQIKNVSMKRDQ